mmetsp:Transcript_30061/g.93006  ORF Transcript_30061/g.93006 Transcript_30061/m.93006 type:complete len:88 (+) Transcript_30061:338-601(+)
MAARTRAMSPRDSVTKRESGGDDAILKDAPTKLAAVRVECWIAAGQDAALKTILDLYKYSLASIDAPVTETIFSSLTQVSNAVFHNS